MEEQNEILAAVKEGFARVDQQFRSLRLQFSEQLDGVSDSLHAEVRTHGEKVVQQVESVRTLIEQVDSKLGLVGENTANVMTEIGRYHANVETPLEHRVVKLEGRVWALEQKKSGTAAE